MEFDFGKFKKPKKEKKEKKESKVPTPKPPILRKSTIEQKLDLILQKLVKKELLDIELTEENIIREFQGGRKLKAYELTYIFKNNTNHEVTAMIRKLHKKGILKKTKENNWYYLA